MGFLSHRVSRSNLEAGDHIYTWRTAFTYSHHGIYVGGDKVVHFTQDHNSTSSHHSSFISSSVSTIPETCLDSTSSRHPSFILSSVSSTPETCLDFPDCGFRKLDSGVTMSCLNCFTGNGTLYRFEYGASSFAFISKLRGGTCTTAKSDPPEDVLYRAIYLLQNGFGTYDLFTNNCEDFALYCKTGLLVRGQAAQGGSSGQATSAIGVPVAAILSLPLRVFVSNPVVIGAYTAFNYSLNRYANDIGVRSDVIKVDVEEMGVCNGNRSGEGDVDDAHPRKRKRNS